LFSVADSLVRLFGEQRPSFAGLQEEKLIERIAGRVADRLGSSQKPQAQGEKRYTRDKEAATFLGVSVATLRSWRSRGEPCGLPVSRHPVGHTPEHPAENLIGQIDRLLFRRLSFFPQGSGQREWARVFAE
jgi:hypothetical protein